MTDTAAPLVVAFVSGKGGVGKTMLAVAFARELSRKSPTLLVDLDFFNRGLTGLMRHGTRHSEASAPDFLGTADVDAKWEVAQVASNLYHLRYPDLTETQLRHIENYDAAALAQSLREYMTGLANSSGAVNIVLDCHGGPDKLSFAACLIAKHSLLVSEPDKITFYGTLHFVRQLQSSVEDSSMVDLHLVFNKVVPAFSVRYLTRFYNREIRSIFNSNPLLAVFPLEVYLTKEFEKTAFLTDAYPFSLLARKMEVLLCDLFKNGESDRIPRAISSLGSITRSHRRRTLGKPIPVLNLNLLMAAITVGLILFVFLSVLNARNNNSWSELEHHLVTLDELETLQQYSDLIPQHCRAGDSEERLKCVRGEIVEISHLRQDLRDVSADRLPSVIAQLQARESLLDPLIEKSVSFKALRSDRLFPFDPEIKVKELRNRKDLQTNEDPVVRKLHKRILSLPFTPKRNDVEVVFGLLSPVAVYWFLLALLLAWSQSLDRKFTYCVRLHNYLSSYVPFATATAIWGLAGAYVAVAVTSVMGKGLMLEPLPGAASRTVFALTLLPVLFVIANQLQKAWREVRFSERRGEAAARVAFVISMLVAPILWFMLQTKS